MKKIIVTLVFLVLLAGCGSVSSKEDKKILAIINNYEITLEEFQQEFKDSAYGRNDTLQSRKEFLGNLINQKLILQDAQRKGLDKDMDFLKMIERFWEQSLLKMALEKKTAEAVGSAFVSDKDIEEAYQRMVQKGQTDKPYDQLYNQIKWEITKLRETKLMNAWIERLRSQALIQIKSELLEQKK